MKYDVVVVGAGPAGSVAAKTASLNGVSTLLLEEHAAIGVPVHCAEAFPDECRKELDLRLDPRCILIRIKGANLFAPSGEKTPFMLEGIFGYIVERKLFDRFLAIEAARTGTDIMVRTRAVGVTMEKGSVKGITAMSEGKKLDIEADLVIAADGIKSDVARWSNLDALVKVNDIVTCYQYVMVGARFDEPDMLQIYYGQNLAPGGYAWIFPKDHDMANVGVGVRGGSGKSAKEYLDHFVKEHSCLRGAKVVEVRAGAVPVGGPLEKMVANGLLVVGTAAHMVNPMTGGGMTLAMLSGAMAGNVASQAVKEGETSAERLREYEEKFKSTYGKRLRNMVRFRRAVDKMSDEDLNHLVKLFPEIYEIFSPFKDVTLREKVSFMVRKAPRLTKFVETFLIQ